MWSVAGTTLTPSGSASGSITGGLTSQFLRGSSVSYSGLTSSLPVSSPSSMYDPGLSEVGVGDAQFESSIARLTASWAPVAQSYWVPDEAPALILTETLWLMVQYRTWSEVKILQRLAYFQRESRRASRRFDNQKMGPFWKNHVYDIVACDTIKIG